MSTGKNTTGVLEALKNLAAELDALGIDALTLHMSVHNGRWNVHLDNEDVDPAHIQAVLDSLPEGTDVRDGDVTGHHFFLTNK
jgi:hypothetical protein